MDFKFLLDIILRAESGEHRDAATHSFTLGVFPHNFDACLLLSLSHGVSVSKWYPKGAASIPERILKQRPCDFLNIIPHRLAVA